jgi:adhesin transport system membrane fusion protein
MSEPTPPLAIAVAAPKTGLRQRVSAALEAAPDDRDGAGFRGFDVEAGDLMSRAKTQRAQTIVRSAVAVIVVLLAWAALAKVDEITKGDARVISSRQLQLVQSLDGGVVSEILVKEGQVVEKDQLLLKIDETRATSGVRESAAQGFALRARQARLRALAEGTAFNAPPPGDSPDELRIVEEERRLYETRLSELNTMLAINQQQLQQRQQELGEMRSRKASADRSLDLTQQELAKTRPLLAGGAVSEVDILRLEGLVSKARGDSEQSGSQIARVQASIGEAQRKIQETELTFRNEARK